MRRLLILRHAKSDWETGVDDHARPLAGRGRSAAARMGRFIAFAGPLPDVVVSSSAARTLETARRAAGAGRWEDVPLHATDVLYGATPQTALEVIRSLPDEAETALLVGHEPTLSELISALAGGGSVIVVTGTLACLEFEATVWREVDFGSGHLERLVSPRALRGLKLKEALERRRSKA